MRTIVAANCLKNFCSFQFSVSYSQRNAKNNFKYSLVVAHKLLSGLVASLLMMFYKIVGLDIYVGVFFCCELSVRVCKIC